MPNVSSICRAAALLALVPLTAWGQETASAGIVGFIHDASQSAVAGARITVVNVNTNATRRTLSGADGGFSVPNLSPAGYMVRIEKEGFQTVTLEQFELRIGEVTRRTVELKVGSVTETVLVEASAPLLQTENGTLGQVIATKQITELPLNGRNLVQLAALSAGVSPRQQRAVGQYGDRNQFVQIDGGRDA